MNASGPICFDFNILGRLWSPNRKGPNGAGKKEAALFICQKGKCCANSGPQLCDNIAVLFIGAGRGSNAQCANDRDQHSNHHL